MLNACSRPCALGVAQVEAEGSGLKLNLLIWHPVCTCLYTSPDPTRDIQGHPYPAQGFSRARRGAQNTRCPRRGSVREPPIKDHGHADGLFEVLSW